MLLDDWPRRMRVIAMVGVGLAVLFLLSAVAGLIP